MKILIKTSIVYYLHYNGMQDTSAGFTLSNGSTVTVKKVADNKYDFEIKLLNGNRKTFVWLANNENNFRNKRGEEDTIVNEAIEQFKKLKSA